MLFSGPVAAAARAGNFSAAPAAGILLLREFSVTRRPAHELTISFGWRPPGSGEQQLQAIDVPIFRFATSKENLFGYQLRISIEFSDIKGILIWNSIKFSNIKGILI